MQQIQMNFNRCIFDRMEWPLTDDWLWELRSLKEKKDKQYQIIKNILEKRNANYNFIKTRRA